MNKDIFSVYYYEISGNVPYVHPIGFYNNIEDAIQRLVEFIPDYKKYFNNSVKGNFNGRSRVGWINHNQFGDFKSNLSAQQPHSAINLFLN